MVLPKKYGILQDAEKIAPVVVVAARRTGLETIRALMANQENLHTAFTTVRSSAARFAEAVSTLSDSRSEFIRSLRASHAQWLAMNPLSDRTFLVKKRRSMGPTFTQFDFSAAEYRIAAMQQQDIEAECQLTFEKSQGASHYYPLDQYKKVYEDHKRDTFWERYNATSQPIRNHDDKSWPFPMSFK